MAGEPRAIGFPDDVASSVRSRTVTGSARGDPSGSALDGTIPPLLRVAARGPVSTKTVADRSSNPRRAPHWPDPTPDGRPESFQTGPVLSNPTLGAAGTGRPSELYGAIDSHWRDRRGILTPPRAAAAR